MIKVSRSNFLVFNGREIKNLEMRNMEPDEFQVIAQIPICLYPTPQLEKAKQSNAENP